jgi:hypothetical protein
MLILKRCRAPPPVSHANYVSRFGLASSADRHLYRKRLLYFSRLHYYRFYSPSAPGDSVSPSPQVRGFYTGLPSNALGPTAPCTLFATATRSSPSRRSARRCPRTSVGGLCAPHARPLQNSPSRSTDGAWMRRPSTRVHIALLRLSLGLSGE